MVDQGIAEV
jgi:hypothetical protein